MNEELIKLEYDYRFIRVMTDEDKLFFIKNNDYISKIKERLKDELQIPDDKLLKVIQMSYNEYNDEFLKKCKDIIDSEIRNQKISKILSENVLNFSEFILYN
jgi:predicted nucleic-acid-binding Zn-ribbon protein